MNNIKKLLVIFILTSIIFGCLTPTLNEEKITTDKIDTLDQPLENNTRSEIEDITDTIDQPLENNVTSELVDKNKQVEHNPEQITKKEPMVVAVTPFDNIGKDAELDYIGFQISEHLSSALTSVEGIKVIERSKIDEIIKEQNFQLQGLTNSETTVEIGALANAKQLLVGSFNKSDSQFSIMARIVDTETGVIINSAKVIGAYSDNLAPLINDLFYKLLGVTPPEEYYSQMSLLEQRIALLENLNSENVTIDTTQKSKIELEVEIKDLKERINDIESQKKGLAEELQNITIGIATEAELKLNSERNITTSIDAAKVKAALFNNSNEEAIKYMESALSQSTNDLTIFSSLSDQYFETVSSIDGESYYLKLLENQLQHNKELSKDAEEITIFRNKVKILYDRLDKLITPDIFTLNVGEKESIELGTVSATVILPSDISISTSPGIKNIISEIINKQDFIQLNNNFYYTKGPNKMTSLLANAGIMKLFMMSFSAKMSYSIQFLDNENNILYELEHSPLEIIDLTLNHYPKWESKVGSNYRIKTQNDGFQFKNGKVEVSARKLKDLTSIKVVLNKNSFKSDNYMTTSNDKIWESILLDRYRQQYLKLFSENDSMPEVKDIVVTQSLFDIGDYLEDVPLISNSKEFPNFVDLTAVAYWGDNSTSTVMGAWQGIATYQSNNVSGVFNNNSKIKFHLPAIKNKSGNLSFKISSGENSKLENFQVVNRVIWNDSSMYVEPDRGTSFLVHDDKLFTSTSWSNDTTCNDASTGLLNWKKNKYGYMLLIQENDLIIYGEEISKVNLLSSNLSTIASTSIQNHWFNSLKLKLDIYNNKLYKTTKNGDLSCVDLNTGNIIWETRGDSNFKIIDDKLYTFGSYTHRSHSIKSLNLDTGALIWDGVNDGISAVDFVIHNNNIYTIDPYKGLRCFDLDTKNIIWDNRSIKGGYLTIVGNNLYVISEDNIISIDLINVTNNWVYRGEFDEYQFTDDYIYINNAGIFKCLDIKTGKENWKITPSKPQTQMDWFFVKDNILYCTIQNKGFYTIALNF